LLHIINTKKYFTDIVFDVSDTNKKKPNINPFKYESKHLIFDEYNATNGLFECSQVLMLCLHAYAYPWVRIIWIWLNVWTM